MLRRKMTATTGAGTIMALYQKNLSPEERGET
jgi:hypothetical protein